MKSHQTSLHIVRASDIESPVVVVLEPPFDSKKGDLTLIATHQPGPYAKTSVISVAVRREDAALITDRDNLDLVIAVMYELRKGPGNASTVTDTAPDAAAAKKEKIPQVLVTVTAPAGTNFSGIRALQSKLDAAGINSCVVLGQLSLPAERLQQAADIAHADGYTLIEGPNA